MKIFAIHTIFLFTTFSCLCQKVKVYITISEECPVSIFMGQYLKEIQDNFEQDVEYYAVFPFNESNSESANIFLKDNELSSFKVIIDSTQTICNKYNFTITPEAVVTNMIEEVCYRGRINNAYYAPGKRKHKPSENDLAKAISLSLNSIKTTEKKLPFWLS